MSSRKQTLKSLLGASDERVDVDLNLDQQTFQAPTVRAGNYSVAAPVYARTNALTQLSNALERYSGPILKQYAAIKEDQSIAMADAVELLTDDELKRFNAGDSSVVLESIKNDEDRFDEMQRKQVISYLENPNNYARAFKRVGSRAANALMVDFIGNMEEYAEDPDFSLETKAREVAEEFGLAGLGRQEFEKQINEVNVRTLAQFTALRNKVEETQSTAATINDLSDKFSKAETTSLGQGILRDELKSLTYDKQKELLQGVVTELAAKNPARAQAIVDDYNGGDFLLGNDTFEQEFANDLQDIITKQAKSDIDEADVANAELTKSYNENVLAVSNAIELNTQIPASVTITGGDTSIEVDLANVKTITDYHDAVIDAVQKNDETLSTNDQKIIASSLKAKAAESTKGIERYDKSGLSSAVSEIGKMFYTETSLGNNIYGHKDNAAIQEAIELEQDKIKEKVNEIYSRTDLTAEEKLFQSRSAVLSHVTEVKDKYDSLLDAKEKQDRIDADKRASGTDFNRLRTSVFTVFSGFANNPRSGGILDSEDNPLNAEQIQALSNAESDKLEEEVNAIFNRSSRTDKELGLTDEELQASRIKEADNLRRTRIATLSADLAADNKLDGRTTEAQQPKTTLQTQDKLNKDKEFVNVEIETGPAGLSKRRKRQRNLTPQQVQASAALNLIQDITTPRGEGNIFNQGIADSYNMAFGVARIDDDSVQTLHDVNRYNAIAYQSGNEMGLTPFQGLKDKDRMGLHFAEEYLFGELVIRTVRDGKAGMTIEELEQGNINGVNLDPTLIEQSSHPIVPFDLINKALTDQDSLTTQEENQLRDYADLLYDTSQIDDAGKTLVIQKMIELQTNAYAQLGFKFAK